METVSVTIAFVNTTFSTPASLATAIRAVRAELVRRIGSHWRPGERIPSIRELSGLLGSSHRSTHQAVQQLVREGVFVARERVGVFVADRLDASNIAPTIPVSAAGNSPHVTRPLAGLRVAVVAHAFDIDAVLVRMWESFERAMGQHDVRLSRVEVPRERGPKVQLPSDGVDAVALFHPSKRIIETNPKVPLVVVTHGLHNFYAVTPATNYDIVSVDHQQGGVVAGEQARSMGITRPCFIGGRDKQMPADAGMMDELSTARFDGFEAGYGESIPPARRLIAGTYSMSCGAAIAPRVMKLSPRPDAVFAASDDLAIGFIFGALALGLHAGKDYRIIGFDGQHIGRRLDGGPLTTIDLPSEMMGKKAAELLAERLLDMTLPIRRMHLGCSLFHGVTL